MKTKIRVTAIALLLASLSACGVKIQGIEIGRVASAFDNAGNLAEKTEEEEIDIGTNTAKTLLSKTQIAQDETIQTYVNTVGYWLVSHTTRPELPWRFIVIDDKSFNAFAAPGGYIFISTGMIASLTNEAELAGVLAHEIAHVIERHHLNALQKKGQMGLLSDLAVLGSQTHSASNSNDRKDVDAPDVASALDKSVMTLYNKGLDRKDELRADTYALYLLASAGYDPYAFANVLQAIASRENSNETDLLRFVKTHPSADQRLANLYVTFDALDGYLLSNKVLSNRFIASTRY